MLVSIIRTALLLVVACSVATRSSFPQTATSNADLIDEAEAGSYSIRHVDFAGNEHTRDNTLRRRIPLLQEGETFLRKSLEQSLQNLSKLKIIEPVTLDDVEVKLDREHKIIDLIIRVKENRESR